MTRGTHKQWNRPTGYRPPGPSAYPITPRGIASKHRRAVFAALAMKSTTRDDEQLLRKFLEHLNRTKQPLPKRMLARLTQILHATPGKPRRDTDGKRDDAVKKADTSATRHTGHSVGERGPGRATALEPNDPGEATQTRRSHPTAPSTLGSSQADQGS